MTLTTWIVKLDDKSFGVLAQKFGRPSAEVKTLILDFAVSAMRDDQPYSILEVGKTREGPR